MSRQDDTPSIVGDGLAETFPQGAQGVVGRSRLSPLRRARARGILDVIERLIADGVIESQHGRLGRVVGTPVSSLSLRALLDYMQHAPEKQPPCARQEIERAIDDLVDLRALALEPEEDDVLLRPAAVRG